jgi:hypothetical protein
LLRQSDSPAALVPFGREIVKLEEVAQPPPGAIAIGG